MLTDSLLDLKRRHLIPCVYHFYQHPMVLESGQGCWLKDSQGRSYLDCYAGVGVVNCGHGNPEIVAAAQKQLAQLQHTTTIYLTEPMLRLAAELAHFIGGGLVRSFFCNSGSEANEGALLLARLATGKEGFIALSHGLHGRTHLTAGVTGMAFWRSDPFPPSCVHFAATPTCGQCPLALTPEVCQGACAQEVEDLLQKHGHAIAGLITESIHGNGGILPLPDHYMRRLRQATRQAGVLLIVDEAQTGFCRTGLPFGFQHSGVEPDILTLCKALGNGLPIAAFVTTEAIAATYTKPGASTFGGNLVSCQAARATLAYLSKHHLHEAATRQGATLQAILHRLAQRFPCIQEVRGRGLMWGVALRLPAATQQLPKLLEALKEQGILAGMTGTQRHVLTLMPPLIITGEELAFFEQGATIALENTQ